MTCHTTLIASFTLTGVVVGTGPQKLQLLSSVEYNSPTDVSLVQKSYGSGFKR